MVNLTRNLRQELLLEGAKSPPKDEGVKIYWFPSLAHKVWTIQEKFNDFNESNDFNDFNESNDFNDFDDSKDFDDFKDSKSYFDKFGALKRLLGPFFKNVGDFLKNVGDFPKNVGLFLRNLPRFLFYILVFSS